MSTPLRAWPGAPTPQNRDLWPSPRASAAITMDGMSGALRLTHFDRSQRPFLVIWEATRACALACKHCRASAQPDRDPMELTGREARRVFEQIRSFGDPPPLLVITGGDPLTRPDLFDLIAEAREAGLQVSLSPSVTPLVTAESLEQLKRAGVRAIALSLDGETAHNHDDFRATAGVFDATLDAWKQARQIGLKVQINTTVTRHNIPELPGIMRMVQTWGAMTWSVFFLVPTGRANQDQVMTAAEAEDVLNFLYDAGHLVSIKATEAHHFRRIAVQREMCRAEGLDPVSTLGLGPTYRRLQSQLPHSAPVVDDARPRAGGIRRPPLDVSAGNGFCFVSHTGDVYPSGFLPTSGGNVRTEPLHDIYRESPAFVQLRDVDQLGGRCGQCEFRSVCGGSRARAYAMTGDVMGEEPLCSYLPGSLPPSPQALTSMSPL